MNKNALIAAALVLCSMSSVATAQEGRPNWHVVMYVSDDDNRGNSLFSFSEKAGGKAAELRTKLTACALKPDSVVAHILANEKDLTRESSTRWLGRTGDRVDVTVVHRTNIKPKVKFDEQARTSRIEDDLSSLFALAMQVGGKVTAAGDPPPPPKPPFACSVRSWRLTKKRAHLKISAQLTPATPATNAATPAKDETPPTLTTTLTTGPMELLFLSANIGRTDAEQAEYDEDTQTLMPPKKPKEIYVGANVSLGDLYDESTDMFERFLGSIYLGLQVEASTKPFKQIGAVVGTRYIPFIDEYLKLGTVSPYVGFLWVRNDSLQLAPAPSTSIQRVLSKYGERKFVIGLSVNIAKAAGWIGSDKPAEKK
jgi:hypothetical protein